MPEGHAIHRLARLIWDALGSQRLVVTSPQGRFTESAAVLDGRVLSAADAVGKHLFLGFAPGSDTGIDPLWLHVHLGLYGRWTFASDATRGRDWTPPPPRGQVRVRLVGDRDVADLVGPNQCEVITTEQRRAVVSRLGPDPLAPDPEGLAEARFVQGAGTKRTPVGTLLMDQSVIAGIGNIYRAELLYLARVNPQRAGASLAARTLRGIWADAVRLMRDGERTGRIVTTVPADRLSDEDRWYVYHRDGRSCLRCEATIRLADLAGRRVYWCPREQRMR